VRGWWGFRSINLSEVFLFSKHSFLYQQPINIIMAANKVVILTGASRGKAEQNMESCRVVTVARSREPMDKLSKQYPGQVEVLAGDLSDLSLGQKAADLAKSKWQRLDSIIVNHGILDPVKRVANVEAEEWRQLFDVNVFSAIALVS
jgi:NADP-dependent 3-hydroxy acid dehydrogenase YdfG